MSEFNIRGELEKVITTYSLTIDEQCGLLQLYAGVRSLFPEVTFEIFLGRMQMCRHAAECLDTRFRLVINGAELA